MNDLIGLSYGWGCKPGDGSNKTDCFQLFCEVRRRLGLRDYEKQFSWVYDKYTDTTFPRRRLVRWILERGTKLDRAVHGAAVLLPGAKGAALGTCVEGWTVFVASSQNVVQAPLPTGMGHFFWMER